MGFSLVCRRADYVRSLDEDFKIRKYIKAKIQNAAISKILIERQAKKATVTIQTARPGIIIGKEELILKK